MNTSLFPVKRYSRQLIQFCIVSDVFSKQEVQKIIELEDLEKFQQAAVNLGNDGNGIDQNSRNSNVMWVFPSDNSNFIFERFTHLIPQVNYDHFMCDIQGFEPFQYTTYKENEFYDWHMDSFDIYTDLERKMSISLVLSEPDTYEGGEFEIVFNGRVDKSVVVKPNAGDVIFFASTMPHRVKPVTSGVRKSLVTWVSGKRQ